MQSPLQRGGMRTPPGRLRGPTGRIRRSRRVCSRPADRGRSARLRGSWHPPRRSQRRPRPGSNPRFRLQEWCRDSDCAVWTLPYGTVSEIELDPEKSRHQPAHDPAISDRTPRIEEASRGRAGDPPRCPGGSLRRDRNPRKTLRRRSLACAKKPLRRRSEAPCLACRIL